LRLVGFVVQEFDGSAQGFAKVCFFINLKVYLEITFREYDMDTSSMKIAIATYDQTIHFYDLDSTQRPKMCIESDVNEVFVPFVEGFFVNFETAKANLERFVEYVFAKKLNFLDA
jgi:hypothetical protein